jgi:hypothetical protein
VRPCPAWILSLTRIVPVWLPSPATRRQRLLASGQLSVLARQSLEQLYASLNPFLLRKQIEQRLNELPKTVHRNETAQAARRKLTPRSVTSFVTQRGPFGYRVK